jgi:hypothetical protein
MVPRKRNHLWHAVYRASSAAVVPLGWNYRTKAPVGAFVTELALEKRAFRAFAARGLARQMRAEGGRVQGPARRGRAREDGRAEDGRARTP